MLREDAEHIMHDVLKDTMFDDEEVAQTDEVEVEPQPELKAPIARKDEHIYEDITHFDSIFKPGEEVEEKSATVVKLRTHGEQESRAQKIKRRLSFTHKEKQKSNVNLRRSREAEDFEIINSFDSNSLPPPMPATTKSSTIPQSQGNSHTTFTHNKLASLFRKGSKRETPKGEIDLLVFCSFFYCNGKRIK